MPRLTPLFFLLSLVFAALFVADLGGYFNRASEPIAVLQTANGTVRRLGLNQLTWDRAGQGTLFGSGDTISTGEGGQAKLVFYAGGEVVLDEGAMLVLGGSTEELQLNFLTGAGRVRVAKESAHRITVAQGAPASGGRKPAAAPAVARVQVEQVEQVEQLAAAAPAAPAKPNAPELTTTVKEEQIRQTTQTLATGGEIASVAKLPPIPEIIFPSRDAVFDLTSGPVPRLEWKIDPSNAMAKDLTFEVILRPATLAADAGEGADGVKVLKSREPVLSLSRVSHGKYFWSVRAVASGGARSPATQARFMEVIVPAQIERPKVLPVKIE